MVARAPLWLGVAALALASPIAGAEDVVKVKIVARDGVFTPPNLEVPAGKRIKIEIANEGRTPMEFESLPLKVEKVLGPGASSSVVINPLKPGEYPFFDDFHPDTSKGRIIAR
ncbi:MAG TPA: cupredoxin domain-containing protein [Casimicrobiaceae bacterium]|jgi:plastocyanin